MWCLWCAFHSVTKRADVSPLNTPPQDTRRAPPSARQRTCRFTQTNYPCSRILIHFSLVVFGSSSPFFSAPIRTETKKKTRFAFTSGVTWRPRITSRQDSLRLLPSCRQPRLAPTCAFRCRRHIRDASCAAQWQAHRGALSRRPQHCPPRRFGRLQCAENGRRPESTCCERQGALPPQDRAGTRCLSLRTSPLAAPLSH